MRHQEKKKIAIIVGTRPEAIKLAPVIKALQASLAFRPLVCDTGQHKDLCSETLAYFGITPDIRLSDVMQTGQSLASLHGRLLLELDQTLGAELPAGVIVQGDTMSAYAGGQAAFYHRIPVFHVEAGLRSHNLGEPFPEEALRQLIARITTLHFAPTEKAKNNLLRENIAANTIHVTGNTGIDALFSLAAETIKTAQKELQKLVDFAKSLVLITVHRRENHGARLAQILKAIKFLANKYPQTQFLLPLHPNPAVRDKVQGELTGIANIVLTAPLPYPQLVCAMQNASLLLTDSGGIQEEAPSFGTPILVLREDTERPEGIEAGVARLVGADIDKIISQSSQILDNCGIKSAIPNPYGDGKASQRIVSHLENFYEIQD